MSATRKFIEKVRELPPRSPSLCMFSFQLNPQEARHPPHHRGHARIVDVEVIDLSIDPIPSASRVFHVGIRSKVGPE